MMVVVESHVAFWSSFVKRFDCLLKWFWWLVLHAQITSSVVDIQQSVQKLQVSLKLLL